MIVRAISNGPVPPLVYQFCIYGVRYFWQSVMILVSHISFQFLLAVAFAFSDVYQPFLFRFYLSRPCPRLLQIVVWPLMRRGPSVARVVFVLIPIFQGMTLFVTIAAIFICTVLEWGIWIETSCMFERSASSALSVQRWAIRRRHDGTWLIVIPQSIVAFGRNLVQTSKGLGQTFLTSFCSLTKFRVRQRVLWLLPACFRSLTSNRGTAT